jgi:hypothetical protein
MFVRRFIAKLMVLTFALSLSSYAQQQTDVSTAWKGVEAAMGRSGKSQPDGTFKFSMPRKDMKVSVEGTGIKPGLALGSWAAFKGTPTDSMVMGDLVLADAEVEKVMSKLQQGGIEVTALHNHLLHESPRVMYMHIKGHGDAAKLASALHVALALTGTPAEETSPAATPQKLDLDTAEIDKILGHAGKDNGGIYQVTVPRAEKIADDGMEIPPSMGVATGINFQPTGSGRAAITGDFVLLGREVNPVIAALRENGIEVTAVHSHMLTEEPRLFFMHFWANDNATKLAQGLRAALDKTNSKK